MAYYRKTREEMEEEWNLIRERVQITELATLYGFTLIRKGRYFSLKEHDSVRINPEKNNYNRWSTGTQGSCIDFAYEFGNYRSKYDAIRHLLELARVAKRMSYQSVGMKEPVNQREEISTKTEERSLKLPQRDNNVRNVFAYLVKTRGIDKDIVSNFLGKHYLYQDVHKNCVFVTYKDDKPVFASLRGTNTHIKFIGDVEGSDQTRCSYIDNGKTVVVVTESMIDAMSYMTFQRHVGFKENDYNYLALSSANKYPAILVHLKEHPEINRVILAYDNDAAGIHAMRQSQTILKEHGFQGKVKIHFPVFTKDWNEELKFCQEKGIRYDYFVPSREAREKLKAYCNFMYECNRYRLQAKKYTCAKKNLEAFRKNLDMTEFPKGFTSYIEAYYKQQEFIDKVGNLSTAPEDIIDHYNKKSNDFRDIQEREIMKRFEEQRLQLNKNQDPAEEEAIGD